MKHRRTHESYEAKEKRIKIARDARIAALTKLSADIEALLRLAVKPGSTYNSDDCEALANASFSIRSMQGGFNRKGRR